MMKVPGNGTPNQRCPRGKFSFRIPNARMTRALRAVSSEKGRDPREFALVAYGGAGPVHALGLAEELGCSTIVVPALAGLFSSLGLLYARPEFHDVHTCHLDARAVDPSHVARVFDELAARLAPSLDGQSVEWVRSAELRYQDQAWEVEVELTPGPVDLRAVVAAFEDEHERLYGVRGQPGSPVVIRSLEPDSRSSPTTATKKPIYTVFPFEFEGESDLPAPLA